MTPHASGSREFEAYLRVREAYARMKGIGASNPSAYWAEELENIDYLAEASPLIVRKLRHHAFHVTGIRPFDYRNKGDGRREHFLARLEALRAIGGDALLVPESPALGGFGYDLDGRLFNVDTLKFYEVLIGMQRGGVLDAIRSAERPLVCEIGAGWGGFAYQVKTLFPRATFVIVDFPELFLFSATYLASVFPDARLLFADDASAGLDRWRDADFIFVPNTRAALVSALPLHLTINMVSFQEMTEEQVREYARIAAEAGCPLLYSLNRERSPYNTELRSVSDVLAEYYQLTEVPVLETDYTSAMKKPPKAVRMTERSELGYRHHVGRLDRAAAPRRPAAGPRVVFGMTLYNNAQFLSEAIDSLLAQTCREFVLVLLDDASSDDTERIARGYAAQDSRVRYFRHAERQAMIATWRQVVDLAVRECPTADYFAWVSDHDRWHPRWLERTMGELDRDGSAVLAYPITRRMGREGEELEKGPRRFDTVGHATLRDRWRHFCHEGVGAGDMVYGLIRLDALRRTGIFREVLRPDRLVVTELVLWGGIRQVPEVLWFRRQSIGTSVERQRRTLVLEGQAPPGFNRPPWLQHSLALWRDYATPDPPPLAVSRAEWARMLLRFQLTWGWRHFRKSETSHGINAAINGVVWARKQVKHHFHHAVYATLVGARTARGKIRRAGRRALYEALMLTHRLGLRGRGEHSAR